MKFRTILADPPWRYEDKISSGKPIRGAGNHYATMSLDELADLPVWRLAAPRAALYLWATNAFLGPAIDLVRAWGFDYKTAITWEKDGLGMGRTYRGTTEHLLFATRGGEGLRVHNFRTHFVAGEPGLEEVEIGLDGVAFFARKGRHSEKPEESYRMIERASYGPFLEMFARRRRAGWAAWGNEAPE
jgi:N6-adenosine-specific RNA methylase IME4